MTRTESKDGNPQVNFQVEEDLVFGLMLGGSRAVGNLLNAEDEDQAMLAAFEIGLLFSESFSFPPDVLLGISDVTPEDLEDSSEEDIIGFSSALNAVSTVGDWSFLKEGIGELAVVFYREAIVEDPTRRKFYVALGWNPAIVYNETRLITPEEHDSWFQNRLNDSLAKIPDRTAPFNHPNPQSMQRLLEEPSH